VITAKAGSSELLMGFTPKTPSILTVQVLTCDNCGVNFVKEEGEWCWECIKDRESLD
jgi:hypothetical protein